MAYKYTTEGCFTGTLLKQPPLPIDNEAVAKRINQFKPYLIRSWFRTGCAVEELGRFGYANPCANPVEESALVYHLQDVLTNPQPIANADGFGPAIVTPEGKKLYAPRYVIATLVDGQIKNGMADVLVDYFGFKQLAPFFGNTAKTYGNTSRVGIYGLCCTRYLAEEHQNGTA